jgi:tRNA(Ile)-lysidine synthase
LGLACQVGQADTRAYAQAERLSIEEAARVVRYRFLAEAARAVGARYVAVAHTADDQAETVLMHFLRGSGLAGLKGMLPVTTLGDWSSGAGGLSNLFLIRPLLSTPRAEVEAYCQARGLTPRQDESNADLQFWRNRLRHELMPLLERYNPRLRAGLARTAEVLAGEHELVRAHLAARWPVVAPPRLQSEGRVVFDRVQWQALTVPEQRALLRRGVQQLRQHLRDVDFTPVEAAVRFSRVAAAGRSCDVLAGLRLSIGTATVELHPWGSEALPVPECAGPMLIATNTLAAGWQFGVEALDPATWSPEAGLPQADSAWIAYVDADALPQPLSVRARQPGDRFQPLGLGGHSAKLSDFMVNQKIPAAVRAQWPLVVCGADIVWVAGLRLDERYKVRPSTQRVARLRFYQA